MQAARTSARQLLRSSSSIIHPSRRAIHSSASTSSALLSSPPSCHHPTCGFHASSRVAAVYSNSNDIYHLQPRPHYMSNHNATQQQLRYASKKKHSKGQHKKSSQNNKEEEEDDDDEIQVEDHPVPVLAKGKKARAAQMKATAAEDEAVEAFHLDKLEKLMDDAVEKFSRDVRSVVGRVERLSPVLLDGIKVLEHGKRFPLQNYATVSVSGAEALVVNLFDPAYAKPVEKAIREATDLGFNPQKADETTLRIPVPRPDLATRSALAKKASDIAESARTTIRSARHQGQQDIKRDENNKIVGSADARKDGQKLQDATQKRTNEVDQILARAKKVLLDE